MYCRRYSIGYVLYVHHLLKVTSRGEELLEEEEYLLHRPL